MSAMQKYPVSEEKKTCDSSPINQIEFLLLELSVLFEHISVVCELCAGYGDKGVSVESLGGIFSRLASSSDDLLSRIHDSVSDLRLSAVCKDL